MGLWNRLTTKWARHWHNDVCRLCVAQPLATQQLICAKCEARFEARQPSPLPVSPELMADGFDLHATCIMTPELKQRLYPFKFYHRLEHLPALSTLGLQYWEQWQEQQPDQSVWHDSDSLAITTIPSRFAPHAQSHMSVLLRAMANHTSTRPVSNLFRWTRETRTQHTVVRRHHRLNNLKGSLAVCPDGAVPIASRAIQGLIVLDDITTTGATLRATHDALEQYFDWYPEHRLPVFYLALCFVPFDSAVPATYNQPSHESVIRPVPVA